MTIRQRLEPAGDNTFFLIAEEDGTEVTLAWILDDRLAELVAAYDQPAREMLLENVHLPRSAHFPLPQAFRRYQFVRPLGAPPLRAEDKLVWEADRVVARGTDAWVARRIAEMPQRAELLLELAFERLSVALADIVGHSVASAPSRGSP